MILTPDEFRLFENTALSDTALQILLDAAEQAIVQRAGVSGARTELFTGGGRLISLAGPVSAITSITEKWWTTDTALATDDYLLWPNGMTLERLSTGTHPRSTWNRRVTTVATPVADDALRKEVQIALLQLAVNSSPGISEETIGDWTQRFTNNNSAWNQDTERDAILARLNVSSGMVVIGGPSPYGPSPYGGW